MRKLLFTESVWLLFVVFIVLSWDFNLGLDGANGMHS